MKRNWTTRTLAKELVGFIRDHPDIRSDSPVKELIAGLAASILTEELELDLDPWVVDDPTLPLEEG